MIKKSIYLVITLFVILIIGILPLTNLPVSASSRGIIRSQTENAKIVSVVGGRVIETKLKKNNQEIKHGEKLLVITAEQLDTQKTLQSSHSSDYNAQLQDLNKLTRGQYGGLQTGQYQRELSAMQEKIAQVQTKLSLAKKDLDRAHLLYGQGVIPKAEYDKFYYDYQGFLTQVSSIREQQLAQWQAQKRVQILRIKETVSV